MFYTSPETSVPPKSSHVDNNCYAVCCLFIVALEAGHALVPALRTFCPCLSIVVPPPPPNFLLPPTIRLLHRVMMTSQAETRGSAQLPDSSSCDWPSDFHVNIAIIFPTEQSFPHVRLACVSPALARQRPNMADSLQHGSRVRNDDSPLSPSRR